jgi:hypothetical protein
VYYESKTKLKQDNQLQQRTNIVGLLTNLSTGIGEGKSAGARYQ